MTDGQRRLVLIVEDNETCAVTLQIALESFPGIDVEVAPTALAALGVLERNAGPVAAVISDLRLPGISGLDLLTRLRAQERFAHVPFVIVSGESDPFVPEIALSNGATAYFSKPYSPSEIRKKLEQLLT